MNSNDARRSPRRSALRSDPATGGILRIKALPGWLQRWPQSDATLCAKKALANAPGFLFAGCLDVALFRRYRPRSPCLFTRVKRTRSGPRENNANDPKRAFGRALKSASRLTKGLTAAGVGIASIAIIGLYWN
jgi:hypothetical protein